MSELTSFLKDPSLQQYALVQINQQLDTVWPELSNEIEYLEILYEQNKSELIAIILSRLYFHLTEYEDALNFALLSNDLFEKATHLEYKNTVIGNYFCLF